MDLERQAFIFQQNVKKDMKIFYFKIISKTKRRKRRKKN